MGTKCTVIGETNTKKELQPITFSKVCENQSWKSAAGDFPSNWENIELIARDFTIDNKDLMFAFDNNRRDGVLYIGHWNDGVAE